MSQTDVVTVLKIETGESENTIKSIKKEISDLKKVLEGAEIGSEAFEKASRDLAAAQQQLKTVMDSTKKTVSAAEGSYDALVATMAQLKKEWRATSDEAKRNEIGKQIEAINTELKELDATLGNHQRNVGNYKGDIIDAYREIQGEVKRTNDVIAGSANQMGDVSDTTVDYGKALNEVNKSTEVTRGALDGVGKMASGVAGGFAAIQGVMALCGVEGGNFEKVMVKLTAAMAIAQGVGGLKGLVEGFGQLKTAFTAANMGAKTLTTSVGVLSTGLVAAVGALAGMVVGTIALAGNMDKLKQKFNNTTPEQKATLAAAKYNVELTQLAAQTATEKIVRLRQLADGYRNLGDSMDAKMQYVTNFKDELGNMGIAITNVNDADRVFIENTDDYVNALMLRAKAAAIQTKAIEDYGKFLEEEAKLQDELAQAQVKQQAGTPDKTFLENLGEIFISASVFEGANVQDAQDFNDAWTDEIAQENIDEIQGRLDTLAANAEAQLKSSFEKIAEMNKQADELLTPVTTPTTPTTPTTNIPDVDELLKQREIILERAKKYLIDTEEEELNVLRLTYEAEQLMFKGNQEALFILEQEYIKKKEEIEEKYRKKQAELDAQAEADKEKLRQEQLTLLNKNLSAIDNNASYNEQYTSLQYDAKALALDKNDSVGAIQLEIDKTLELQGIRERAFDDQMAQIQAVLDAEKEQDLLTAEQEAELLKQYNAIQQEKVLATADATNQITALNKQMIEQQKADNRQLAQNITTTFTSALNATSNILSAVQEGIDTTNKEGFEKSKNLQIANATIQAIVGITTALAGAYTTKTGPWDIPLAYLQAATIAATTGIQIANIKKQTYDGSGSSGNLNGGAGVSPNISMADMIPINYTKDVLTDTETAELNKGNKVYVLESDITETQNEVSVKESNSSF